MGSRDVATTAPHVLLVEARLPQYRVTTWTRLRDALAFRNIRFTLAVGHPDNIERGAQDERDLDWAIRCSTTHWHLGPLHARNIRSHPLPGRKDVTHVILEQALTDLGTYRTWARARRYGLPVGLFGHGMNYSHSPHSTRNVLKRAMTLRADWFFSYTAGGSQNLRQAGYPADRITVVNNALEDLALQNIDPLCRPAQARLLRESLVSTSGVLGLFIGALEPRKGLDVLLAALPMIVDRVPHFHLIVAGSGQLQRDVMKAAADGLPVSAVGRVDDELKARVLLASDVMIMPRHLGLAVVDALHAGRPVVTTVGRWHNPEAEYLTPANSIWTAPDARALADGVIGVVGDPTRLARMQRAAFDVGQKVTLDNMVSQFADGIARWVSRDG